MPVLPPAEKLPLAVRKNLRDDYESKKEDYEKQVSDLLGQPWTFNINALEIWPYHNDESFPKERIGSCIQSYVEGVIYGFQYFTRDYGDDGKQEVNSLVYKHSITMAYDDTKRYSYCGPVIKDGQLVILFNQGSLGVNCSYCLDRNDFQKALNEAPPPPSADGAAPALSYSARTSIRQDYDPKIEDLRKKIADQVKIADIKLEPNFEANFALLKKNQKKDDIRDDWEKNLGEYTYLYFEGLEYYLRYHKFGDDEMLHEGFQEVVTEKEVQVKIVEKLETQQGTYNEVVVKGGVVYIQTTPKNWGVNITEAAAKILDQL